MWFSDHILFVGPLIFHMDSSWRSNLEAFIGSGWLDRTSYLHQCWFYCVHSHIFSGLYQRLLLTQYFFIIYSYWMNNIHGGRTWGYGAIWKRHISIFEKQLVRLGPNIPQSKSHFLISRKLRVDSASASVRISLSWSLTAISIRNFFRTSYASACASAFAVQLSSILYSTKINNISVMSYTL